MNPNDILSQQQATLNQMAQHSQHELWGVMAIQLALFVLVVWVIHMFYARLRDIADELRKLRISYESSHAPQTKGRPSQSPATPLPPDEDSGYKPK
jgi:hypothetical protein